MSLLAKTRSSLFQGKERFGGLRTLYLRMDARCLAALLVIFVTGILLRMGLTSTPSRCTITELTLGYREPSIDYAAVQQDVEAVLAGMPNWVENPTGFPEPAPDSPMNVPGEWSNVFSEGEAGFQVLSSNGSRLSTKRTIQDQSFHTASCK
jgi:hypothetical protein